MMQIGDKNHRDPLGNFQGKLTQYNYDKRNRFLTRTDPLLARKMADQIDQLAIMFTVVTHICYCPLFFRYRFFERPHFMIRTCRVALSY